MVRQLALVAGRGPVSVGGRLKGISVVGVGADLQEILAVDEVFELGGVELYSFVRWAGGAGNCCPAEEGRLLLIIDGIAEYVCGPQCFVKPEQDQKEDERQQPERTELHRFPEG